MADPREEMREMLRQARADYYAQTGPFGPFTDEEEDLRDTFARAIGEVSVEQAFDVFSRQLFVLRSRN